MQDLMTYGRTAETSEEDPQIVPCRVRHRP